MDFKKAFHKAYLLQQDITEVTEENIFNYSIDPDRLVLLDETDKYWVIKVRYTDSRSGEFIDVVYKDTFEMVTLDIG